MMEQILLKGHGQYAVPIVGELYHQDVLKQICGGLSEPMKCKASLAFEDANPRDPGAVRVDIEGNKVGYLSREMARIYREIMLAEGYPQAVGQCEAIVEPPHSRDTAPPKLLDRFYESDAYEVFLDIFDSTSIEHILRDLAKLAVQVIFDPIGEIEFGGARFCLTGLFILPKHEI